MKVDINSRSFISPLCYSQKNQRQTEFMMILTTLTKSCGATKNGGVGTGVKIVSTLIAYSVMS